ncbi:transcriptional regulator, partial [Staphylococcus saprophyticus]
ANIQGVLEIILMQAQDAMEGVLAKVTMNDIVNQVLQHNE